MIATAILNVTRERVSWTLQGLFCLVLAQSVHVEGSTFPSAIKASLGKLKD